MFLIKWPDWSKSRIKWRRCQGWVETKWRRCRGRCHKHSEVTIKGNLWSSSQVWWVFLQAQWSNQCLSLTLFHLDVYWIVCLLICPYLQRLARDPRYILDLLRIGFICMREAWICLLVVCLYCLTNLLYSAWLGTSDTHFLALICGD